MQSQQPIARAVRIATLLMSMRSAAQGAEPNLDQWLVPWAPFEHQTLAVHGEARNVGGVTLHTLRVTDRRGSELYLYEGTELMSVAPLRVGPEGDETLLITLWSGGIHTSRLLVLRGAGSKVKSVADLLVPSEEVSLFDVDGDGYDEVLSFELVETRGRPVAEWPLAVAAYRWTGAALQRMGQVPASQMRQALRRLFRARPQPRQAGR
jgi:hypothetical protein